MAFFNTLLVILSDPDLTEFEPTMFRMDAAVPGPVLYIAGGGYQ